MAATLIGFTGLPLAAGTPESDPFPLLPIWDQVLSVSSGGGYKDNVFLSHFAPEGSPFLSTGLEALALRTAPEGPQVTLFGTGDMQYYTSARAEHTEYFVTLQAKAEQSLGSSWKTKFGVQYLTQDQVTDVSVTETNRAAVRAHGHRITARPELILDLSGNWHLALELHGSRQFYSSPLDDYWEAGPELKATRTFATGAELSLSYEPFWVLYDHELARTQDGEPIPDKARRRQAQDVRLNWRQYWDERRHWKTDLSAGLRFHQENGGGYFDFFRWFGSARMVYRVKPWRVSAEVRLDDYHYENQSISFTDPTRLRRVLLVANTRVEFNLSRHLLLSASYQYEQDLSNDSLSTYQASTAQAGLTWEF
jgi:hypothetical protein